MPTRTSPRKKPTEMLPTRVSPRKKLTAQETSEDQPLTEKKIQETFTSSSSGNVRKVSRSERTRMVSGLTVFKQVYDFLLFSAIVS